MATKIYGASDDLIEVDGDVRGEVSRFNTDELSPVILACSDGTILKTYYGKGKLGIWTVSAIKAGKLLEHITECFDEDADPYSDVAVFMDGLEWVVAFHGDNIEFEEVR